MFGLAPVIPADAGQSLNLVFMAVQVGAMVGISRWQQESGINQHMEDGGRMESNWKAAGVAIMVCLALLLCLFTVVALVYPTP